MFNFLKRSKKSAAKDDNKDDAKQNMSFIQRLAMKRVMSMSPERREKLMRKAITPENISKNKDNILAIMEQMKSSGQMSADQIELAKQKLGL